MLTSAIQLFLLRELPFSRLNFSRWQAVLAVTLTGLLAGILSAQAYASEAQVQAALQPAQPVAAFTEADLAKLFEQADKPMQLAALSDVEMRETEGAWLPVVGLGIAMYGHFTARTVASWYVTRLGTGLATYDLARWYRGR